MAPKASQKKVSSSTSTPKTTNTSTSRIAWKSPEQLEWMLSQWSAFIRHQNEKSLDRFWPRVYHGWFEKWPITPPRESVLEHGSRENAILTLRVEINAKIRMWFHNHARPSSKAGKPDLQLSRSEKRKVAPAQAYCSYAWDKGLRETTIEKWQEHKQTDRRLRNDDSLLIPIDFKMKVAREEYNALTAEQKKEVDDRREEERKKLYRSVQDIEDAGEKKTKLLMHQRNQPAVARSLLCILKNLEDQAGAIAHLIVGHIDPGTGESSFQGYSQGKTDQGMGFQEFCGDDWDDVIEKRFKEWGMAVYGELGSERRALFTLSSVSNAEPLLETASEEGRVEIIPPTAIESSSAASLSTESDTPQNVMTFPITRKSARRVVAPAKKSNTVTPSQAAFVSVARQPTSLTNPPVLESTTVTPGQAVISAVDPDSLSLVTPILESSSLITPVLESSPLTTPVLESSSPITSVLESTTVTPGQTAISPTVLDSASSTSPVLGASQNLTPNTVSPMINQYQSLVAPPPVLTPSQTATPNRVVAQISASHHPVTTSFRPTQEPQPTVAQDATDLVGVTGNTSGPGPAVTTGGIYRSRCTVSTAPMRQSRSNSIDGVPDIMLSLGPFGYEVIDPSSPQEHLVTSTESDVDISTSAPAMLSDATISAPTFEDLIIPSSQQSLEECLVIPPEPRTVIPDTSSVEGQTVPSSQPFIEDQSAARVVSKNPSTLRGFHLALREIPTYTLDRSDLPTWLLQNERLDYILSVEGGEVWKILIDAWIKQERRLGFGMSENLGASLPMKEKPGILKDYFKWRHQPSKGDSVALPEFADEVVEWWASMQPTWRYKPETPDKSKDYSYILAGGKKGVFLLILCLAWWDKAYGKDMEREKAKSCEVAGDGVHGVTPDFSDMRDHDVRWFNTVNDLLCTMELAQAWPLPGESTSGTVGVAPIRARKRQTAVDQGDSSPRKKTKTF